MNFLVIKQIVSFFKIFSIYCTIIWFFIYELAYAFLNEMLKIKVYHTFKTQIFKKKDISIYTKIFVYYLFILNIYQDIKISFHYVIIYASWMMYHI